MTEQEKAQLAALDESYRAVSLRSSDAAPSVVYHYTSAGGLLGIVGDGMVRASNFEYLNDTTEIHHGRERANNVIGRQLVKDLPRSHRQVLTSVQRALSDVGRGREFYLACFCEKGDLLSQWRGYGSARDRFSIGFEMETSTEGLSHRFNRVLYRREDQESRVRSAVGEALGAIKHEKPSRAFVAGVSDLLAEKLIAELVFFKDWSFRDEREWRAVYAAAGGHRVRFDVSAGFVRPFVNLWKGSKDTQGRRRLPITTVITFTKQAVRSVELLLEEHGYRNVTVRSSNVPYRNV